MRGVIKSGIRSYEIRNQGSYQIRNRVIKSGIRGVIKSGTKPCQQVLSAAMCPPAILFLNQEILQVLSAHLYLSLSLVKPEPRKAPDRVELQRPHLGVMGKILIKPLCVQICHKGLKFTLLSALLLDRTKLLDTESGLGINQRAHGENECNSEREPGDLSVTA